MQKEDKKTIQLGMHYSTASGRLVKDILWSFIQKEGSENCCKCGNKMTRESFSIEHLTPWLDSEKPVEMFFDLENISYSHLSCNIASGRRPTKTDVPLAERMKAYNQKSWNSIEPEERKRRRREKYLRTGN